MFRTITIVAFALGVVAAPALAGAGCGGVTTAHTQTSLEVAQAGQAGQSTPQTPKVESGSN